jgi:hypothetical protein
MATQSTTPIAQQTNAQRATQGYSTIPGSYNTATGQLNPGATAPTGNNVGGTGLSSQQISQGYSTTPGNFDPVTGQPKTAGSPNMTPVNTSQPNPATTNINPPNTPATPTPATSITPPTNNIAPASATNMPTGKTGTFNGQQYNLNAQGQPVGVPITQGTPFQTGLKNTQASGVPAPQDSGAGASTVSDAVNGATPTPQTQTTPPVQNFFDPNTNKSMADQVQQMMDIVSPQATRDNLANEMANITGEKNTLAQEKLQLMNMQNVMKGSEQDIRDEVTKANGFATNSQVLALTTARNSTLLKDATFLQDQMTALQDTIANDTSLYASDKADATAQATQRMGIMQYIQTNQNNQLNAYRSGIDTQIKTPGGLTALAADPASAARAEQVMGYAPGTIAQMATASNATNALDNQAKQANINQSNAATNASNASAANSYNNIKIANGMGINSNGVMPTVSMNGDGTVNKGQQNQFISALPQNVQAMIKGISNYSINPSSFSTSKKQSQGGLTQGDLVSLATQYDPSYDSKQYATRQALIKNFTSGKYSTNINALNTTIGHLADLQSNFAKLSNTGLTPYNALKNEVAKAFGSGGITSASTNISASVGELAGTFKSAGATDQEIKNLGTVNTNSSPAQIKSFIETASQLLASRLDALEQTYSSGMGKATDAGFLSPTSQQNLLNLQKSGYDIKVPELAKNPTVMLKTFNDSSPQNANLLQQLHQAMPNATTDEIISLLENNGQLQ